MRKRAVFCLVILVLTGILMACSDYEVPDEDNILDYLEERYKRTFSYGSDGKESKDGKDFYVYEDEDGRKFHVVRTLSAELFGNHYYISDDYLMQWLVDQKGVMEPLENAGFGVEEFNTMGERATLSFGYRITISSFDELEKAVKLSFEVVNNEDYLLPDYGYQSSDIDVRNYYPEIVICSLNGGEQKYAPYISFQSKIKPYTTDLVELTEGYSYWYVDLVREGVIDEVLSDEVLENYGPKKFTTVLFQGEMTGLTLYRAETDNNNVTHDQREIYYIYEQCEASAENLEFEKIAQLASLSGFHNDKQGNADIFCLKKENNEVSFIRNEEELVVTKNGCEFDLQGSFRTINGNLQLLLTVEDIYRLFGLSLDTDKVNEKVEIRRGDR